MSIQQKIQEIASKFNETDLNIIKEGICELYFEIQEQDFLEKFINLSPKSVEIFKIWKICHKNRGNLQTPIIELFKLIENILLNQFVNQKVKINIINTILKNKMKLFYHIFSTNQISQFKIALKLLLVMLENSNAIAQEILPLFSYSIKRYNKSFNLKSKQKKAEFENKLEKADIKRRRITKKKIQVIIENTLIYDDIEKEMENSLKSFFINLFVSFINSEDLFVIKELLGSQEIFYSILEDFQYQSASAIKSILVSLKNNVLLNSAISKKIKSRCFTSQVLNQFGKLFNHILEYKQEKSSLKPLIVEFLEILCISPTNGISYKPDMPDLCITKSKNDNHYIISDIISDDEPEKVKGPLRNQQILALILTLQPTDYLEQHDLIFSILDACYDLYNPYLTSLKVSFEPRPSLKWISNILFISKLVSRHIPKNIIKIIQFDENHLENQINVYEIKSQTLLDLIFPRSLTKTNLSHGFLHSNRLVQHYTILLITHIFKKIESITEVLYKNIEEENKNAKIEITFPLELLTEQFPDLQTVIAIRKRCADTFEENKIDNFHYFTILRLFSYYIKYMPDSIVGSRFDFTCLISPHFLKFDKYAQIQIIRILTQASSIQEINWFQKSKFQKLTFFGVLIDFLRKNVQQQKYNPRKETSKYTSQLVSKKMYDLLILILKSTNIFAKVGENDENDDKQNQEPIMEMESWIDSLVLSPDLDCIQFFDTLVTKVVQKPYQNIDPILEILEKHDSLSSSFSHLLFIALSLIRESQLQITKKTKKSTQTQTTPSSLNNIVSFISIVIIDFIQKLEQIRAKLLISAIQKFYIQPNLSQNRMIETHPLFNSLLWILDLFQEMQDPKTAKKHISNTPFTNENDLFAKSSPESLLENIKDTQSMLSLCFSLSTPQQSFSPFSYLNFKTQILDVLDLEILLRNFMNQQVIKQKQFIQENTMTSPNHKHQQLQTSQDLSNDAKFKDYFIHRLNSISDSRKYIKISTIILFYLQILSKDQDKILCIKLLEKIITISHLKESRNASKTNDHKRLLKLIFTNKTIIFLFDLEKKSKFTDPIIHLCLSVSLYEEKEENELIQPFIHKIISYNFDPENTELNKKIIGYIQLFQKIIPVSKTLELLNAIRFGNILIKNPEEKMEVIQSLLFPLNHKIEAITQKDFRNLLEIAMDFDQLKNTLNIQISEELIYECLAQSLLRQKNKEDNHDAQLEINLYHYFVSDEYFLFCVKQMNLIRTKIICLLIQHNVRFCEIFIENIGSVDIEKNKNNLIQIIGSMNNHFSLNSQSIGELIQIFTLKTSVSKKIIDIRNPELLVSFPMFYENVLSFLSLLQEYKVMNKFILGFGLKEEKKKHFFVNCVQEYRIIHKFYQTQSQVKILKYIFGTLRILWKKNNEPNELETVLLEELRNFQQKNYEIQNKISQYFCANQYKKFERFAKLVLRKRFAHLQSMQSLANLVFLLSQKPDSEDAIKTCFQLLQSHSKFIETITKEKEGKYLGLGVIELVYAIVKNYSSKIWERKALLEILLNSYTAKRNVKDILLLQIFYEFEKKTDLYLSAINFDWGNQKLEAGKNFGKRNPFSQLNFKSVIKLVSKFPVNQPLRPEKISDYYEIREDQEIKYPDLYDPSFLLQWYYYYLISDPDLEIKYLINAGGLTIPLAALSSHDEGMRKISYQILSFIYDKVSRKKDVPKEDNQNQLENQNQNQNQIQIPRRRFITSYQFSEQLQVRVLLQVLKNSIEKPWQRIPSIITYFLCRAAHILMHPSHHLYLGVNHFLIQKPFINLNDVPMFYELFNSSSIEYKQERIFFLRNVINGLKTFEDFSILKHKYVPEILFSFFASKCADYLTKQFIIDVVERAVQNKYAMIDLIKNFAVLSWINSQINFQMSINLVNKLVKLLLNIFIKIFRSDSSFQTTTSHVEKNHRYLIFESFFSQEEKLMKENEFRILIKFCFEEFVMIGKCLVDFVINTENRSNYSVQRFSSEKFEIFQNAIFLVSEIMCLTPNSELKKHIDCRLVFSQYQMARLIKQFEKFDFILIFGESQKENFIVVEKIFNMIITNEFNIFSFEESAQCFWIVNWCLDKLVEGKLILDSKLRLHNLTLLIQKLTRIMKLVNDINKGFLKENLLRKGFITKVIMIASDIFMIKSEDIEEKTKLIKNLNDFLMILLINQNENENEKQLGLELEEQDILSLELTKKILNRI
ncbi:NUCLEOLAR PRERIBOSOMAL-ASSOCIATED PROTEIN 1 [Anaeramoeba ignava]|uniref:NUCLEOLAR PRERIBOSOMAL-ASSOCIATED PROTEIN 1 n=1 Tax=Anaeramoeba ignava TaxID=1746090 RepID=A0A9Q0LAA1_ANAIG|nr:NUCLEOLAR PRERIBOSOMAL-ASSOCIATED PROTEIN 1 [Anaeramoeba ignava]